MITLKGKGVSGGIAFGRLVFLEPDKTVIPRRRVEDMAMEFQRLETALAAAIRQLEELYTLALDEVGEKEAEIFQIHRMMLEDEDYCDSIRHIVETQQVNAEYAVSVTADNFAEMFTRMDDPYLQARAADVRDISGRLIKALSGGEVSESTLKEQSIIGAEDLSPSQTLRLDKTKAMGFVTLGGSRNSHTAILARTMNVPAVIKANGLMNPEYQGQECILDGFSGEVYLSPDQETTALYEKKYAELQERKRLLQELKGKETVTLSGHRVRLYANIGGVSDVWLALQNDAEGIGLFRTEFIYLESNDYPTEQEQFAIYKQVAENMAGRPVVFRTLDIGADKQAAYFGLAAEENPALGLRGIRICLTRKELFKTQLRALYRASAFGKVAIMFPMIISKEEVTDIMAVAKEVRAELERQGIPYDPGVELGIMIETPAAALISDELASEVDFFSIGTNDLIQYTLAIDRQNHELDSFYNPHHPAILKMIRMVADNAHAHGKWVGICGELGADAELTDAFMEMGMDELSVSPQRILGLRDKIRKCL